MLKILLCGFGNIGKKLFETDYYPIAKKLNASLTVYDPKINSKGYEYYTDIAKFTDNEKKILKDKFDFAFLCLPTETVDHKCDCSIVKSMIEKLSSNVNLIIIKSTVYVGFTKEINKYQSNVIFSPEFKGTTQHMSNENFLILGGEKTLSVKVAELYKAIKPTSFKFSFTDSTTAELTKYMDNCFLALKVTFCCEMAEACKEVGVVYDELRNQFLLDERISPSHTFVYQDHPYYDSHCFNKDIPAFNGQFHLPLMMAVEQVNTKMKEKYAI